MTRSLTIRGIPDAVLARLRARAAARHRSLNGEVLAILTGVAEEAPGTSRASAVRETVATYEAASYGAATHDPATHDAAAASPGGTAASPGGTAVSPGGTAVGSAGTSLLDVIDRDALAAVCRRYHIGWLAIFGSHARGDASASSDVDVVVEFEPGRTPGLGIIRVADALRRVLGGRRVDLVTRRGLAPRLRDRVLAEARELYAA
jgi:uncharacterized protein